MELAYDIQTKDYHMTEFRDLKHYVATKKVYLIREFPSPSDDAKSLSPFV